jgi:tetratricopeptide (TPR) repeat protein
LALTEGEYENARHELLRARALHEQLGSRIGLAGDLTILGRVADAVKDFASAVDLFEQSLLIDRAIGAQFDEALNLDDQADALTALEEHDAAIAAWWLERQIHERIADQAAVARLDEILGQIHDQIEPAEWSALEAALASDAEGIRRAGVARVVAQNADGRPQTADG